MAANQRANTWFDEVWPLATAATGVGYLATAYAVARWLTRTSPAVHEKPRDLAGVGIDELRCETGDGIVLKGWVITPLRPRATIALFHGLRSNRTAMLGRVALLTAAGYRCVTFDHRGHGESGGAWTSFGYHERHDIEAVSHLIRARWPHQPCAAIGCSMGAAALCSAGLPFDAFVLESLYHDLARAFNCRVGCGFPTWFRYFRRGIIWFVEQRLSLRIADVSPVAHIARLAPRPILLLTGSEDVHAPPDEVHAIADTVSDHAQVTVIAGTGHLDLFENGGTAYSGRVLSFLDEHLFAGSLPRAA